MLIWMLGLNKPICQLAMENSVHWYVHMLRENCHVLKRALDFKVEGQEKKAWLKRTWKKSEGWLEQGRNTLLIKMDC